MDMAPAQVYAKLLEDGEYLCSTRTMYRVPDDADQVRELRALRRHPEYKKPQLVATAPNQVWSWDTTKLSGPTKGTCFTLYVIIDIFSRYIVGWNVTSRESAAIAQELIAACCKGQGIVPEQLTVHADRGSPMVAKSTAQLYVDLGIAKSHSRPHTSNDNPDSEANFRTVKYRPEMPEQLGSLEHARQVARSIIDWYNDQHYHTGLALLHPIDVHHGRADAIVAARQRVLDDAHRGTSAMCAKRRPVAAGLALSAAACVRRHPYATAAARAWQENRPPRSIIFARPRGSGTAAARGGIRYPACCRS